MARPHPSYRGLSRLQPEGRAAAWRTTRFPQCRTTARQLRRALDAEAMQSVTQFIEHDLPESLYRRLATVMFGEKNSDMTRRAVLKYADDVARSTSSARLRKVVLDAMPPVEEEPDAV